MLKTDKIKKLIFDDNYDIIEYTQKNVVGFFETNKAIKDKKCMHSFKTRIKGLDGIVDKVRKKEKEGIIISENNLFDHVTDIVGVRVLHLHIAQLKIIDKEIRKQVTEGEWKFHEKPKAYTWDPETIPLFKSLDLKTETKESYYTSIHYVIKTARKNAKIRCEIQVRTLFEEIWGEIDHSLRYKGATEKDMISKMNILSKITSAGRRYVDFLFE